MTITKNRQRAKETAPGSRGTSVPMTSDNVIESDEMKVRTICCGYDNFSYLLICKATGEAAVIDPTEAYPVWREVEASGVRLVAALCTHHHNDHIAGLEDLLAEQPGLAVYGFENEALRIAHLTRQLKDGDSLTIGNLAGRALHTPGHTTGSICYLFGDRLFTGDTLFGGGCGRLFEGTAEQMYVSLNNVIGALPDDTLLYFGHEYTEQNLRFAAQVEQSNRAIARRLEELQLAKISGRHSTPSSLGIEKATNPFLRCQSDAIRKPFPEAGATASGAEIFSLLRTMRNSFQG